MLRSLATPVMRARFPAMRGWPGPFVVVVTGRPITQKFPSSKRSDPSGGTFAGMGRQPGRVERFPDCTGVLVAGGTASRLGGIPKGLLRIEGEPIAARSLRLFDELFAGS